MDVGSFPQTHRAFHMLSSASRQPIFPTALQGPYPNRKPSPPSAGLTSSLRQTQMAGLKVYWVDSRCTAPYEQTELHSADVYRMCDVIRGAQDVLVLLPDFSPKTQHEWGARMWTLPEALLARRQEIRFCLPDWTKTINKLAMASQVWDDGETLDGDRQPTRFLAEDYSNVLTFGRLE